MPEDVKNMLSAMGKRVAKLIPYVVLLSGVVVWSYLNSIGRVDIFPDILSFNAGLMSILVSVMIFALAISMTLIVPSSILIFIKSAYEKNSRAVSVLSKLPAACLCLSILYLAMVFIPFIPEVAKVTKGYEPGIVLIISIILFLSFCFVFLTLMRNFKWNKDDGVISNIGVFIGHTCVNLFGTFSATMSISIPISFLMQSSKGESTTAVIFALLFMIAFSFLTFFPSVIYFTSMERTKCSVVSAIHQISLAIVGVVLVTFLFFPNISTIFIYSSLNAIGLVSKTPHFYLINGEKYKPAMFHKTSWDTQVLSNMGEHFYIKGVNVFSVESKNLICPLAVVKIRDETYERDYVSFVPFADSKKIAELKKMTKDCLVLDDGDIQQWDTLFDDNGKVRE
ncbi:hypothetical protein [Serratia liquefaciens]|uniref:hypothetical protein n=1 Tax=Serratia liquefaciens TaxID=614 RepID=UPI00061B87FA|nr:hypothetical protein [Serratia liquefaciens]AKE12426.1 hypothetical protein XJ20_21970 [Serratia liquefaciens]